MQASLHVQGSRRRPRRRALDSRSAAVSRFAAGRSLMSKLPFIVAGLSLTLVGAAVAGVYLWDASRDDLIARGVSAGGVEIGELRAAEALSLIHI